MGKLLSLVISFILFGFLIFFTESVHAQDAKEIFTSRCSGCHSIGEGDRVGPDLSKVSIRREASWIKNFIKSPGSLIEKGDSTAKDLLSKYNGIRMPDQNLTDIELKAMVDYFMEMDSKGNPKPASPKIKPASEATKAEIEMGRDIFEGTIELQAGGPSCISCHNVQDIGSLGGGTLAKDLTHVYGRLGDSGLHAALESAPFPLMKDIFSERKLNSDEVFALKAFFASSSKNPTKSSQDVHFLLYGILGMTFSFGLIGFFWSGRLQGVRKQIVKRGRV